MKNLFRRSFLILLFLSVHSSSSYALEVETHKAINKYIAQNTLNNFSLDSYLKNNLGLTNGKEEEFTSDKTRKVFEWLELGGEFEDKPPWTIPYLRSINHFHNPLTEKGYSGFWGTGFLSGMSSTQWMLLPQNTQSPGGYYSWYDVRDYYYKALTLSTKNERDTNFAQTFRGLGQLMHLIQDVSVPEHARDDGHYLNLPWKSYEKWVESDVKEKGVPIPSTSHFFNGTINNIASFVDINRYNGSNPQDTVGNTIGLAEFTNANFLSWDTMFTNFPYPSQTGAELWTDTTINRNYLKKTTEGVPVNYLAVSSFLYAYRIKYFPQYSTIIPLPLGMDSKVYQDYASLLLPRAVGYSASLINYFFRGQITMEKDPNNSSQHIIKNESDEYMSGNFTLYYDDVSGNRKYLTSWNKSINAKSSSDSVSFTAPTDAKEKGKYILVFQGTMGNEIVAVVGRGVKVEECIKPEEVEIIYENGVLQMKDCEGKWKPIYTIGCIPSGEHTQATNKRDSTSFFVVTNWYQEYRLYIVKVTNEIENRNGLLFRKLSCSLSGAYVGSSDTWTSQYSSDITSSRGYGLVDITISGISTSNSTGSVSYSVTKKANGEWAFIQTTKGSSSSASQSTSVLKTPVLDAPQSWYGKTLNWYYPGDGYGESATSCLYETPVRCYFRIDGLGEFYSDILGSPSVSETETGSQMIGGSTSIDLFTGETVSSEAPHETLSCQYRKAGEAKPPLHSNFGSYVPNDIPSEQFCDWTTCPPSTVWTSIPGYIGGAVYWDYNRYLKLSEEDKKRITIQYYGRIISSMIRVPWQNCQ